MGSHRAFAGHVLATTGLTGILFFFEWIRIGPSSLLEFVYLALLGVALVPISILLVSTVAYLARGPMEFDRMPLATTPPVAILYVAFNDMLLESIHQTLENLECPEARVWLLSDSTDQVELAEERRLPATVQVFRRPDRRGGKAGAINDWLRAHGTEFSYVVPMDADAILAKGSLPKLLEIAEHPNNRRYAGFQTLMEVHPSMAPTPFARLLGRGVKWGTRIVPLANQRLFGQGMYWGSNALLRTQVVTAAGGWVEGNICEDFALTARLDAAGHPIALIDMYNFEGFPPDALSLRERTVRWCKANLSVAPSLFRMNTSFAVRLNVIMPILFYAMAPTLLALLVINVTAPPEVPLHRFSTALGATLLAFVVLHRLVLVPRTRTSLSSFFATLAAETLVVLSMALRISWAFVDLLIHAPHWEPSRKRAQRLSAVAAIRASIPELAFGALLISLIGIYRSPLPSTVLASVWIASFVSAPAILWWSSRPSATTKASETTPRAMSDRTTSSWTNRFVRLRTQTPSARPVTKPMKMPIHR